MNILITGCNGQLGHELIRCFAPLGCLFASSRQTDEPNCRIDLANIDDIKNKLELIQPQLILNAGAYTAVDQAEIDFEQALKINAQAPTVLARYAAKNDIPLIHFSTDYVFNGNSQQAYLESDPIEPVNRYGESKYQGEQAILESGCKHLIFRTSWVYSGRGKNFMLTMLKLANTQTELNIVSDQLGTPTWARSLAQLCNTAVIDCLSRKKWPSGIYHLSSTGQTSWHGFADRIFQLAAQLGIISAPPLCHPVETTAFPTPAKRPAFSVLDNAKFSHTFELNVPSWQQQLQWCIEDLQRSQ